MLSDLLKIIKPQLADQDSPLPESVGHLRDDSRQVAKGDWLLLSPELSRDESLRYAKDAVDKGAVAVFGTADFAMTSYIRLADLVSIQTSLTRCRYKKLLADAHWVGITGTNGKTTIAWCAAELWGQNAWYIGTLGLWHDGQKIRELANTTPTFLSIAAELEDGGAAESGFVAVEVSSIGIDQKRMDPVMWTARLLSTLGRDHLDYHENLEGYHQIKKDWFAGSAEYHLMHEDLLQHGPAGVQCMLYDNKGNDQIPAPMQANLNAARKIISRLGKPNESLPSFPAGRFERWSLREGVAAYIDYAHTPDALSVALEALRTLYPKGRVLTVIGAGGDRDRGKRPLMTRAVLAGSQIAVFTSDNPRNEKPDQILDDLASGLLDPVEPPDLQQGSAWFRIANRESAIKFAASLAEEGDVVFVAGKGDEEYLEVAGVRTPYSDRAVLVNLGAVQ